MNDIAWQETLKNINRTKDTHLREFFAKDPKRAKRFTASSA